MLIQVVEPGTRVERKKKKDDVDALADVINAAAIEAPS